MEKLRAPGDEIRGVGHYHTRVAITCDKELDRLHQEEGEPAPWMDNTPEIQREHLAPLHEFLHALIVIGDPKRRIFFARLSGITWIQIGAALLRGATPQAAEKQFAEIITDFPDLARAFPERGRAGALPGNMRIHRSTNNG